MINDFLDYNILGNFFRSYLIALAVFLLSIIILKIFKQFGISRIKKALNHKNLEIGKALIETVESINWFFYIILSLWISFQFLFLPDKLERYFSYLVLILAIYYLINVLQKLLDFGFSKFVKKSEEEDGKIDSSLADILKNILKGIIWGAAVLFVLQNLGFNVTTLIAGLGIGGFAVAFALQNILGDIFACFSIYFDRPFEAGDYIIVGEDRGTVKKIGIKSTRIQSLWGHEIVISNKELTENRIHNYKRMEKRRIEFNFGVTYDTSVEKLKKIPEIVGNITKENELVEFDRAHFQSFGDFSLNFSVVYFILTPDFRKYMDVQQEINLALKKRFEKEGIEFAFPTQTVFLKQ